jgi:hypothetical protein
MGVENLLRLYGVLKSELCATLLREQRKQATHTRRPEITQVCALFTLPDAFVSSA